MINDRRRAASSVQFVRSLADPFVPPLLRGLCPWSCKVDAPHGYPSVVANTSEYSCTEGSAVCDSKEQSKLPSRPRQLGNCLLCLTVQV